MPGRVLRGNFFRMIKRLSLMLLLGLAQCLAGCNHDEQALPKPLPGFVTRDGDALVINQGEVHLTLLPQVAARVSSLKIGRREMMYQTALDKIGDWGTVLWSSPQAEWNWPPLVALDSAPYTLEARANQLEFTSAIDPKTGYQFSKIYGLAGKSAIAITYKIYNHSKQTKRVGAIEVSRYRAEGQVLFPQGETQPVSGIFYPLDIQIANGLVWFPYDAQKIRDDHHKVMMDGKEGWVAYRDKGYLVIKQFEDLPPDAVSEGEREIEIFAHVDHTFIEIKQQSAAETLAPGEFLTWTVLWRALKLPPELRGDIAPEALADFVRAQLMQP